MRNRLACALLFSLLIAGCERSATEATATVREPTTPSRVVLAPEAQMVYERSLLRDPAPSCAALTAGIPGPVAALLEVAEEVEAPPSSPIRAATCLIREHASAIEPRLERWVSEREAMGLGLLVLNHLDHLDAELATRLVGAALSGEFSDAARPRIARSSIGRRLLDARSAEVGAVTN